MPDVTITISQGQEKAVRTVDSIDAEDFKEGVVKEYPSGISDLDSIADATAGFLNNSYKNGKKKIIQEASVVKTNIVH